MLMFNGPVLWGADMDRGVFISLRCLTQTREQNQSCSDTGKGHNSGRDDPQLGV